MSKIAFIYPGQGAQKIGMGKDFYERESIARDIYEQATALLNLDMKKLCFEENDKLDITEYTQAALVTTCLAMTAVIKERGLQPDVTAGLSLGEYCAIVTAGGISVEDAIKTVRQRGILMQDAVPLGEGAMAAVLGISTEVIEAVLKELAGVSIANYNCPGQIVITGTNQGIAQAEVLLKEAGAKRVVVLKVSGPFHSQMLVPAGKELSKVLEQVEWKELQIPYVTNITSRYIKDTEETKRLLSLQVSESVRWEQSIRNMIADGVDTFVEIGPGKTLAGFMKKIDRSVAMYNIETLEDVDKVISLCLEIK